MLRTCISALVPGVVPYWFLVNEPRNDRLPFIRLHALFLEAREQVSLFGVLYPPGVAAVKTVDCLGEEQGPISAQVVQNKLAHRDRPKSPISSCVY